jgi:hypothetical protein
METFIGIVIFVGVMIVINKLGLGYCGCGRSNLGHKENSSNKSCCSSKK